MRAAKERIRLQRAMAEPVLPEFAPMKPPRLRKTGFTVTIVCHDDGERSSFTAARGPFGLTISPTLAGRKVACVFANYRPAS